MEEKVSKRLTIILGAGASHGCAGGGPPGQVKNELQPPLARDVFAPTFHKILGHYPRVEGRSPEVRARLNRGENLEKILRDLLESAERNSNNWPLDVPIYMRELFWTISEDYLRGSSKFDILVGRALDYSFEKILFLNLNYDLLLESAITRYDGHEFTSLDSYLPDAKKWLLVKPHGSVNWAKILENCPKWVSGDFRAPSDLQEAPVFAPGLKLVRWHRDSGRFFVPGSDERLYLYPQIVVPVDRPKEFVCPQTHADRASAFVESCGSFLLIGFSAHDDDVLGLLKLISEGSQLTIVSEGDAREIFHRIRSVIPGLDSKGLVTSLYDGGFSAYVEGPEFERLMAT